MSIGELKNKPHEIMQVQNGMTGTKANLSFYVSNPPNRKLKINLCLHRIWEYNIDFSLQFYHENSFQPLSMNNDDHFCKGMK